MPGFDGFWYGFSAVITMTAGTIFLMWIGEQIDEYGIGNGISLIIMAGIVARIPDATKTLLFDASHRQAQGVDLHPGRLRHRHDVSLEKIVVLICLFVAVVVAIIAITKGQRRIPTQSAKHVRGRRVYGGTRQFLPLARQPGRRHAGHLRQQPADAAVLPVHDAAQHQLGRPWAGKLRDVFERQGYVYNIFYIVLIYFFCYFWTAITFNPKDMANNLKDYGSFIPGYRPGKRTADYLERSSCGSPTSVPPSWRWWPSSRA